MIKSRQLLIMLITLVMLLAACGDGDDGETISDTVPIGVPTLQPRIIVEDCTDIAIENWADFIYPNTEEFIAQAQAYGSQGADTESASLTEGYNQLIVLRDDVTTYRTPDCLAGQHQIVLDNMQSVIRTYQGFAVGRLTVGDFRDDLESDIARLQNHLEIDLNRFMTEVYNNN